MNVVIHILTHTIQPKSIAFLKALHDDHILDFYFQSMNQTPTNNNLTNLSEHGLGARDYFHFQGFMSLPTAQSNFKEIRILFKSDRIQSHSLPILNNSIPQTNALLVLMSTKKSNDMKKDNSTIRMCCQPKQTPRKFEKNVSAERQGFILSTDKKWVNGTHLTYCFLGGPESQRKVVRKAFQIWKNTGIGLTFQELSTTDEALVRISFKQNAGSWSYVGRDILQIPLNEATMNFGWPLDTDSYGMTTALHEIGHTLGFQHEHQNPFSGIVWDRNAVIAAFKKAPNHWSIPQIEHNILNAIPQDQVKGSAWDWKSIMHYAFDKGLILKPAEFHRNGLNPPGVLSQLDIQGVKSFCPESRLEEKQMRAEQSRAIPAKSGKQFDFVFEAPATAKYTFATSGTFDTVMVVSEKNGPSLEYLSGDDDSGTDHNATITLPLVKGRTYIANIRVMYAPKGSKGSICVKRV